MKSLNTIFYSVATLGLFTALSTGIALDVITTRMHEELIETRETTSLAILSERLARDIGQSSRYDALWTFTHDRAFLKNRDQWRGEVSSLFSKLQAGETDARDLQLLGNAMQSVQSLFATQDQAGILRSSQTRRSSGIARLLPIERSYPSAHTSIQRRRNSLHSWRRASNTTPCRTG